MISDREWLEADGLGGFASGTADLVRTRRYHALLLRAVNSPSHRFVLVNGLDVWIRTPEGNFPLSAQRYAPDIVAPDGGSRIESFNWNPWPTWIFRLPHGRSIVQEIFVPKGQSAVVIIWTLKGDAVGCSLEVRPFLSGRDLHSLHKENQAFDFVPQSSADSLIWRVYPGVPLIAMRANGTYVHAPTWYRNFVYLAERERGLDDTEDLASPGSFLFSIMKNKSVLVLASPSNSEEESTVTSGSLGSLALRWRKKEKLRRAAFPSSVHRAADSYLVRRGDGSTILAGYPWFTDWGRDTFIAMRGLCLTSGRLHDAGCILLEWAKAVSAGMLPNYFPEGDVKPEFNSVDASLWYVIAIHHYLSALATTGYSLPVERSAKLYAAVDAILTGYMQGTRFGIRPDSDGLLFAGEPGIQLTWMDAKVGDLVVTPRIGKPVEVQALWINALRAGAQINPVWGKTIDDATTQFRRKFWNEAAGCLYDVVDVNGIPGRVDSQMRPNQIFAVGGLPWPLFESDEAARIVQAVESQLLTPLGLRSLTPSDPNYRPRYEGGVRERDSAYHQGTVWPWLMGPFVEAWLRVRGNSPVARSEANERFVAPLRAHLDQAGLGHISEIADGAPPHFPRGCPFQAWSLGEYLRILSLVTSDSP